jgi:ClpP class serine protease
MPSWTDLLNKLESQPNDQAKSQWLSQTFAHSLQNISRLRGGRNVLFYGSAFLQKPGASAIALQITYEEINGFMSCMYGMQWDQDLTLLMHTPGGVTNSTETIVSYLRSKFKSIEVIVPTFAMSAGTMISLAADKIILGRQSSWDQ